MHKGEASLIYVNLPLASLISLVDFELPKTQILGCVTFIELDFQCALPPKVHPFIVGQYSSGAH